MTTDLHTAAKQALEAAYLAGFDASGEGYNAEYPFGDRNKNPEEDAVWVKNRDNYVSQALAEQPAQQEPVAWTVAGPVTNWSKDFSAYRTQHYVRPVYTRPQAPVVPPHREPLPFNKADMEGLDINQRLGFKLGWRSAEEAHGIGEKK